MNFATLDRRIIYVLVALSLSIPLLFKFSVPPARMKSAEKFFEQVEQLDPASGKAVFVSLDFGPNSQAENLPQAEVVIEHLMRRRIPIILYTQYALAEPFLESIPEQVKLRLKKESPDVDWQYGADWVNLGYRPSGIIILQNIASTSDLAGLLKKDSRGNGLQELPLFTKVKTLDQIAMLAQFTSLVGTLDAFMQFFQRENYRPTFVHGCTSITIPQAFIYLDSGQLAGLLEGVAGAAWYSKLMKDKFPARGVDAALLLNTGLGVAHLLIIALVILGNASVLLAGRRKAEGV